MNKRFQEIRDRVSELKDLITNSSDIEEVRKYRSELDALQTELTTLSSEEHAKREIQSKGKEIVMEKEMSRKERLALALGLVARGKRPDEEQTRALGNALTTTATTYVEATSGANGVNNGGVMIATDDVINDGECIVDFYETAIPDEDNPDITNNIVDYFVPKETKATPTAKGNDYYWNLKYNISETDFKTIYVAAAYIKTATEYVFFNQARYSVKTLAADYIYERDYDPTTANGSLANLANLK